MKGLVLKELIMLKKQWLILSIIAIAFSLSSISGEKSMFILIIAVFLSILPVNFMTQDEISKWQQYSLALPYGRKNIVSSKYVFTFILSLISMAVITIVHIVSYFVNSESVFNLPVLLVLCFLVGNIYPLIMLPLAFRFNYTNRRMILMVINCCIGGAVGGGTSILLYKAGPLYKNLINIFSSPFIPFVIIAVVVVIYLISWCISVKVYEKKDL